MIFFCFHLLSRILPEKPKTMLVKDRLAASACTQRQACV